jgi:transcriptional regulator with GAF, ATPase, and Fis domain
MADRDNDLLQSQTGSYAQLTDAQLDPDRAELHASLAGIARLVTGAYSLEELLGRVARFATDAIPGADGAGVTLWQPDRPDVVLETLAASADFVREIDEIQYAVVDEGPCITAARELRTVRSGSLDEEELWPRFGPRVAAMGVHSALSLPLVVRERVVGAINIYAFERNAFDQRAAEVGQLFAAPAAVAVHNAHVLAAVLASTQQMQKELSSRPIIDQAIGLVRARTGASTDDVFAELQQISQKEEMPLTAVAQRIVDQAVERVKSRDKTGGTAP